MLPKPPLMPPGPLHLAREGRAIMLVSFLATVILFWVWWPLGALAGLKLLFSLYFFRDPNRNPPADPALLVSPADGTVLKIESLSDGKYLSGPYRKISIFMSPFNVHVNRIPCDGVVKKVDYHAGKFFVASLDKASEENERNTIVLTTPSGADLAFTQIAGLVARRIVSYLKGGETVSRSERYGIIRYGSRMEVSIPLAWPILVSPGAKVSAGQSPLAKMQE